MAAVAISPRNLPTCVRGLSTRLHTPLDGMVISSARHPGRLHWSPAQGPAVVPLRCPLLTESRFARRRALPSSGTASSRCFSRHYPAFIAPIGSCARPKSSCRLRSSLFRQVFAGCYEPLLEDGPSRRYLCDPCTGAWVRTPPRPNGVLVRFFPLGIGLPLGSRGSARERSRNAAFRGGKFRGCNHSLMFRLPCSLGPPTAQTVRAQCPFGLRAVYTGQYPRRRRSRAPASLRVRIRTIDTAGLVRAIALIHLLDRSLVGCS